MIPHSFTATRRRTATVLARFFFLAASLLAPGCSIKRTVKVNVPQAILQAKTASFDELLGIIRSYDKINSLSCNELDLSLTSSRKIEIGELEKYRTFQGYILLRRPDSVRLVILAPVTKSRGLDVLSVGDKISVWYQRDRKFFEGRNSARKLVIEDPAGTKEFSLPIRGSHIYEAIFPQSLTFDAPGVSIGVNEESDSQRRYYVLSVIQQDEPHRFHILRKIWIERSGLTIARQQVFADGGQIVSDITYSAEARIGDFFLPLAIHMDRPIDQYTLDLRFSKWNINPDLPADAFELTPPPGAEIIQLKDK